MARVNRYGQAIGDAVLNWTPPPAPPREVIRGTRCGLEPLDLERHGDALCGANERADGSGWTFLPAEPPASREAYLSYLQTSFTGRDPLCFAIVDQATQLPVGVLSYQRIEPQHGCIEIGHISL